MALPSISICVPTRNRAEFLRKTLAAMQCQTMPYTELIVGDDASNDGTRAVVESFHDSRIRYVRHPQNIGIYANWNALIALCSGDYICVYHDHDHYYPTILDQSSRLLDQHPEMSFVHTALVLVNSTGAPVDVDCRPFPPVMSGHELRVQLANNWNSPVMAATAMVRRSAYQQVGPYQYDTYGLGCDKHMWFHLGRVGTVGYVSNPQVLIQAREKGIGTAKPNWSNELRMICMRADEIDELYCADADARSLVRRTMGGQRDWRLLILSIRALLLEEHNEWALYEETVIGMLGAPTHLLYRAVRALSPLRGFLRYALLPIHYDRINRNQRAAKIRAVTYVHQHPELNTRSSSSEATVTDE